MSSKLLYAAAAASLAGALAVLLIHPNRLLALGLFAVAAALVLWGNRGQKPKGSGAAPK